jgi:hypothetical protein
VKFMLMLISMVMLMLMWSSLYGTDNVTVTDSI